MYAYLDEVAVMHRWRRSGEEPATVIDVIPEPSGNHTYRLRYRDNDTETVRESDGLILGPLSDYSIPEDK